MPSGDIDVWPLGAVAALQRERWVAQRDYVARHSAFYRRLWAGQSPPESLDELAALPLTTKSMLRDSQAAAPPYGDYLAAAPERVARIHRTAGSSGKAMNIALSAADAAQYAEAGGRALRGVGLGPGHRIVHCLNYMLWMGGFTDHTTLEATGATVIPFGVGGSELLIRTMRDLGATAIYCTPSYPAVLEQVIADHFPDLSPRDLGLEIGILTGEPGLENDSFRSRVEHVWGFQARNLYGISDVLTTVAGECAAQHEALHFAGADALHVELIDPDSGAPIAWRDGAVGELVVTHLKRECHPVVRYRVGDLIEVAATDLCACGRTSPRIRVLGRADDMVIVRGVNVFPSAVAAAVNAIAELNGEFVIRIAGPGPHDRLPVEAELRHGVTPTAALVKQVEAKIRDAVRASAAVTLLAARSLPRTAGKSKRVIRET